MPLTPAQLAELNKLGASNMRARLQNVGAGSGASVPGFTKPDASRGDVEEWPVEKDREASKLQVDTLWYAKAAFWRTILVGIVGIIVTIVTALLGNSSPMQSSFRTSQASISICI